MPFPHVSWKPVPIAVLTLFLLASFLLLRSNGNIPTLFEEDKDSVSGIEKAYLDSLGQPHPTSPNVTITPDLKSNDESQEEDPKPGPTTTQNANIDEDPTKTISPVVDLEKKKKHDQQQVNESFISSLLMILVSELGDKTFLIAAVMAMTHPRWVIFSAAFSALVVMSMLSAALGHVVPNLVPKIYTNYLAAFLFFAFGVRMLKEGMNMDSDVIRHEMEEVQSELAEKEEESKTAEMEEGRGELDSSTEGRSVLRWLFSPTWITAFVLTFLAEWGDRSQIATIALAAARNVYWVTIGTILGHCACTFLAVIGGRLLASRISVRTVTLTGAVLFLLFGMAYVYQAQMGLV